VVVTLAAGVITVDRLLTLFVGAKAVAEKATHANIRVVKSLVAEIIVVS
jgi:hypothetical protein